MRHHAATAFCQQALVLIAMYILEALHPEGWVHAATFEQEYWAIQQAQARSRSDGRHYRILEGDSRQIVWVLDRGISRGSD